MDLFNWHPGEMDLQDIYVSPDVLLIPHLISSVVFETLDAVWRGCDAN